MCTEYSDVQKLFKLTHYMFIITNTIMGLNLKHLTQSTKFNTKVWLQVRHKLVNVTQIRGWWLINKHIIASKKLKHCISPCSFNFYFPVFNFLCSGVLC